MLQEYAAALRLFLPEAYTSSSHHHMLASAFTASLQLSSPSQVGLLLHRPAPTCCNATMPCSMYMIRDTESAGTSVCMT